MLKNKHSTLLRTVSLLLSILCCLPMAAMPCTAQGTAFFFPAARPATATGDGARTMLIPGGQPFGVRLQSEGVMVISLSEVVCGGKTVQPARDAGLRVRDIIVAVNGKKIQSAEEVTQAVRQSGGAALSLSVVRDDRQLTLSLLPQKNDRGEYACGMYIRDSASGIGTLTFILPDSGLFGGLGHGVCDSDTGALVPLSRGNVLSVEITGAVCGQAGKPGELRGSFTGQRLGCIVTNSPCGVFGLLSEQPQGKYPAMEAAHASEVREGAATILCTLGDDGIGEYTVEISRIDHSARPTKSFTVHVTDKRLLDRTGGIIQGMSGSPIIQDGKLVGAVTHVLVNDPTRGYGIFIENMLEAAK